MTKQQDRKTVKTPVKANESPVIAHLRKQLVDNFWEILIAVIALLISVGFFNTFGRYILIITLIGGILFIVIHDRPKILLVLTFIIGILYGFVVGNYFPLIAVAISESKLSATFGETPTQLSTLPTTPVPTATQLITPQITSTSPTLTVVLKDYWLKVNTKLRILDGNATLSCDWIYDTMDWAECTLDVIGQKPLRITLRAEEDYLFRVYSFTYYLSLIETQRDQILITIVQVPPELVPTPTLTPYPTKDY